jgi:2-dehydropantoate 2-reductase
MTINIGVIGVGGIGGYFGGKLCRLVSTREANVYFVARGPHLDQIRRNGLLVKTVTEGEWICRPTLATERIQDLPALDICLVCVKSYDLTLVVQQLREKISQETILVSLLNGVDIYERIRANLSAGHVYPGCVYIGAHIESSGTIVQRGGSCKILFGNSADAVDIIPNRALDIFDRCSIESQWLDDVCPALWTKFIFIVGISLTGAAFGKTLGQMMESSRLSGIIQSVMREAAALAEKKGIALPADVVDNSYEQASHFAYETKTSFQRDFETAGKPDERDTLGFAILRMGAQLGVETPGTRELWEILQRHKPSPVLV